MIVGHREQFTFPLHDPSFTVYCLALGAMTVAATVVKVAFMAAVATLAGMATKGRGTAFGQSFQCA